MGDHRLTKRVTTKELENMAQYRPQRIEKERTDHVAEDRWVFDITGDWSIAALDPGV